MNYQAEINEYAALLDTPEAQAVLQAEEWPPLASVPVPPAFDPEWLPQVPRDMADAVTRLRKKRIPFGMPALCALGASSALSLIHIFRHCHGEPPPVADARGLR